MVDVLDRTRGFLYCALTERVPMDENIMKPDVISRSSVLVNTPDGRKAGYGVIFNLGQHS